MNRTLFVNSCLKKIPHVGAFYSQIWSGKLCGKHCTYCTCVYAFKDIQSADIQNPLIHATPPVLNCYVKCLEMLSFVFTCNKAAIVGILQRCWNKDFSPNYLSSKVLLRQSENLYHWTAEICHLSHVLQVFFWIGSQSRAGEPKKKRRSRVISCMKSKVSHNKVYLFHSLCPTCYLSHMVGVEFWEICTAKWIRTVAQWGLAWAVIVIIARHKLKSITCLTPAISCHYVGKHALIADSFLLTPNVIEEVVELLKALKGEDEHLIRAFLCLRRWFDFT